MPVSFRRITQCHNVRETRVVNRCRFCELTFLTAVIAMTLSALGGHTRSASLFKWHFSYICGASRGPSASAELLCELHATMRASLSADRC